MTGYLHNKELSLKKVLFLPAQGRLITLSSSLHHPRNVLHFWEIEESKIEKIKTTVLDSVESEVVTMTIDIGKNVLMMGTSQGDIYQLHLWSFILDKEIISHSNILDNIPEDHHEDPGEVVAIVPNSLNTDQVMIGYSAGFMMLWDTNTKSLLNILKSSNSLLDLCWRSEDEFYSCHSDGSISAWDAENGAQLQPPRTPYGPYPCRSIGKIYCRETETVKWSVFLSLIHI